MECIEHQTDILTNLDKDCKLQKVHKSKSNKLEGSKRNEGHKKVKGNNVEVPQEFVQNYKAEENEENRKRMIIKVEKFECSDDILPEIAVDYYELEQNNKNQNNMLVKLEHCCDKLENVLVSTIDQIEESKNNERHKKIKVDEFSQNVKATQEFIQNYEANEYEVNGRGMIIKVEKFECGDDILSQIAINCYEPEQNRENRNNVLFNSEHLSDKLAQTFQVILNQPEEYEENQWNKDSTAIVASAVYEVSGESNSSRKPYSKLRRRGGNLSEKQNYKILNVIDEFESISDNYKDTISSELTQDDDSKSVNVEAKVLVTDSQCYVALEKLSYICDICRYVTVVKELLVSHMKLHIFKQSDSVTEFQIHFKNQIISEKHEQLSDKPFACSMCSYKSVRKSTLLKHQLTHTGEKPFACNMCSYKSAHKSSLNFHKLKHTGEKPFACNMCSYKSAHKSSLNIHKLKHTGEKPFACNMCSYKSAHKSSLNIHKLKHTGEKPFACNLCSYKSARKGNLNIHKLTHTGEKRFACNLCSYKSTHKSILNVHKLKHTGLKPFACNMCSYKGASKRYLTKHKLKHTGEKRYLTKHKLKHTG